MRRLGPLLALLTMLVANLPGAAAAQGNQRSAQSDCTREVQRRGFTVLSTGNFQQSKDGWQLDIKARDHRGKVTDGTCFVETRTGDVSLYGFGWGGSGTVDSFEFNCASKDERYRECQLPVDGRARLVKRKSDSPCIEGSSWGQKGDRVWVDRGCRATFEVVRGGGGGGAGGQPVECRSEGGRYRECPIPRGYTARLVQDFTSGKCRTPGSWGTRDGVVWVNHGCKGRFELSRTGGGGVNPGQQQRAEVQCRNEAQRQYINVSRIARAEPRGSYWFTTVDGTLRGQSVRADCRFYPSSNRAELSVQGGGTGGGSGGGAVVAERACLGEAQRQGLRVVEWDPARPIQGGYGMRLQLRKGNQTVRTVQCSYRSSTGQVELRY
jgi:hypothetical protein